MTSRRLFHRLLANYFYLLLVNHLFTHSLLHFMRLFTRICWALLGIVFIFSGLVKLNDPVGTAIKLEEYFEVFAIDLPSLGGFFEWFKNQSRFLSIALSSL